MTINSRASVLLAAGQGSRMWPLTEKTPKSMLEVGGVPLLKRIINDLVKVSDGEIVVVTGYQSQFVNEMIASSFSNRVRTVHNQLFHEDVNILSVDIGVDGLLNPENGYTIIETDLLIEQVGWQKMFDSEHNNDSFWVTHGRYSKDLTGGIIHEHEVNQLIDKIAYVPDYQTEYNGWHKMLGILSVSPDNVKNDRLFRKSEIQRSIKQYYMSTWINNLDKLPCRVLDLSTCYASSFNTPEAFQASSHEFLKLKVN